MLRRCFVLLLAILLPLAVSADVILNSVQVTSASMPKEVGGGPYSWTFVGKANGATDGPGTSISTTSGTINVAIGDLIIAAVQWEDDSTAEITTGEFDDNNNQNDLTKDSEIHNSGNFMNMHLWTGVAGTANATASFTATIDTSVSYKKIVVFVYRPSGGTPAKDITGTPAAADDSNASQTSTTGSFSTASSTDVVCAFAGFYTSGSWSNQTINSVTADRTESPSGISGWCRENVTALSSVTASSLYSQTRYWVATAIAFKAE